MTSQTIKKIQSVERVINILRCFEQYEELTLTEISQMVGLHKSTTAGLVNTLRAEKFLENNGNGSKLKIGTGLLHICANANRSLKDICQPILNDLYKKTKETVCLAVPMENGVRSISKYDSLQQVRVTIEIGNISPFYCSAMGKAILAFWKEHEIRDYLDQVNLKKHTEKTVVEKGLIMKELLEIRNCGYAVDIEGMESGVFCVAAPIIDSMRQPIASIGVYAPINRMKNENIEKTILTVCTAKNYIENNIL